MIMNLKQRKISNIKITSQLCSRSSNQNGNTLFPGFWYLKIPIAPMQLYQTTCTKTLLSEHYLFVDFILFCVADQLLAGKSQGPDPNDVPPAVAAQGLASVAANIVQCETIEEEEDSSEYEESSDDQQ